MNFIAASILWHCDEDITYYIIKELFTILQVQNNYTNDLSGVQLNVNMFYYNYLGVQERHIFECLEIKGIVPLIIFPEWFVTLGMSTVPLLYHTDLVYMLIKYGWSYLYHVMRSYLVALYDYYKNAEFGTALGVIKNSILDNMGKIPLDWENILT